MTHLHHKPQHQRLWQWMQRNDDTAVALIMGGLAALFIIGIVSVFTYAARDVTDIAASPPMITAGRAPVETTGSSARPRPPNHDPREDEQLERVR